jgi:hypothetical protein
MADKFFSDDEPYYQVCDRLDAGEDPAKVYAWAMKQRGRARDSLLRDEWDEALRYIREENPGLSLS